MMDQLPLQSIKLTFITTSHDELAEISRIFAMGVDPSFLADAGNPVIFSLRGSYASGKSLMSDTMRDIFLQGEIPGLEIRSTGKSWIGGKKNGKREISTTDIASWLSLYDNPGAPEHYINLFLQERTYGGASFLQNCGANNPAGVHIWVEKPVHDIVDYQYNRPYVDRKHLFQWNRAEKSSLRDAFNKAAEVTDKWARYVEIDVTDIRLITSPLFLETVETLSRTAKKVEHTFKEDAKRPELRATRSA